MQNRRLCPEGMALWSLPPETVSFLQQALSNSTSWQAYNDGVKMGCWGLVIYAATGAICSGKRSPSHPGNAQ